MIFKMSPVGQAVLKSQFAMFPDFIDDFGNRIIYPTHPALPKNPILGCSLISLMIFKMGPIG